MVAIHAALGMLEGVGVSPLELVRRHLSLDLGSLDAEDQASNVMALKIGARIISAYQVGDCREWVCGAVPTLSDTRLCRRLSVRWMAGRYSQFF